MNTSARGRRCHGTIRSTNIAAVFATAGALAGAFPMTLPAQQTTVPAAPPAATATATPRFDPTRVLTRPLYDKRFGRYETGRIEAEWLADGRKMRLLKDVRFVDSKGQRWKAPEGWIVDGASIPQPLWSFIKGPYEGAYRDASVVHDYACDKRLRSSKEAAEMFYDAMRCNWVPEARAKLMYWAVLHGGPQWGSVAERLAKVLKDAEPKGGGGPPAGGAAPPQRQRELSASDLRRALKRIAKENPSLEELEKAEF